MTNWNEIEKAANKLLGLKDSNDLYVPHRTDSFRYQYKIYEFCYENIHITTESIYEPIDNDALYDRLYIELETLTKRQRQIIDMYIDRIKLKEIAAICNIKMITVQHTIQNVIHNIRKQLNNNDPIVYKTTEQQRRCSDTYYKKNAERIKAARRKEYRDKKNMAI